MSTTKNSSTDDSGRASSEAPAFFVHPKGLAESSDIGDGTRVWAFAHVMDGARGGEKTDSNATSEKSAPSDEFYRAIDDMPDDKRDEFDSVIQTLNAEMLLRLTLSCVTASFTDQVRSLGKTSPLSRRGSLPAMTDACLEGVKAKALSKKQVGDLAARARAERDAQRAWREACLAALTRIVCRLARSSTLPTRRRAGRSSLRLTTTRSCARSTTSGWRRRWRRRHRWGFGRSSTKTHG